MASRLLVIDKSQELLDLYQIILQAEGYDVLLASFVFQNSGDIEFLHPDLILLDYSWNNHTHEDILLQQLKMYPATAALPVILATTDEQVLYDRGEAWYAQGVSVMLKPFEIDDLLQLVQQALVYETSLLEHTC